MLCWFRAAYQPKGPYKNEVTGDKRGSDTRRVADGEQNGTQREGQRGSEIDLGTQEPDSQQEEPNRKQEAWHEGRPTQEEVILKQLDGHCLIRALENQPGTEEHLHAGTREAAYEGTRAPGIHERAVVQ